MRRWWWPVGLSSVLAAGCAALSPVGSFQPADGEPAALFRTVKEKALLAWTEHPDRDAAPVVRELSWSHLDAKLQAESGITHEWGTFYLKTIPVPPDTQARLRASTAGAAVEASELDGLAAQPRVAEAVAAVRGKLPEAKALLAELRAHCEKAHRVASEVRDSAMYNEPFKNGRVIEANACLADRDFLDAVVRLAER